MTLAEIVKKIERVASVQPSIKTIVPNDVFKLNAMTDVEYGVFAWTQGQHSSSLDNMITYQFTFFYVDRLRNDLSNQVEVQSVGVSTLGNIIKSLEEQQVFPQTSVTFQTFNQRFLDECSGTFCNVAFDVPMDFVCAETY